jgi:hypothetical protein
MTDPPTREMQVTGKYVIVRADKAACFAGVLVERVGREVTLRDARRLWAWAGAPTLSDLAVTGTTAPRKCKFPVAVSEVVILDVAEVLTVTDEARTSIEAVAAWAP